MGRESHYIHIYVHFRRLLAFCWSHFISQHVNANVCLMLVDVIIIGTFVSTFTAKTTFELRYSSIVFFWWKQTDGSDCQCSTSLMVHQFPPSSSWWNLPKPCWVLKKGYAISNPVENRICCFLEWCWKDQSDHDSWETFWIIHGHL